MKYLAAYGWRHTHWSGAFYPEDLPVADDDDWRLSYYSNEFNAVLVPADYWKTGPADCADWLDSVHEDFQFFVECRTSMLDVVSLADLTSALKELSPQLSALIFSDRYPPMSEAVNKPFVELADSLGLESIDALSDSAHFILIEDELLDLRAARTTVEQFVARSNAVEINEAEINKTGAAIIVKHPKLQAENLRKFRTVLDIMGY
jgi:hypothetical protein